MRGTSLHLKVDVLSEVNERLKSENASLRGAAMGLGELCDQLEEENKRLKRKLEILKAHGVEIVDAVAGGFEVYSEDYRRADAIEGENARYRELVEILRRDWHIEASWDGLRKFWYVGLTEEGVRERDERDAKALEAANIETGELRELVRLMIERDDLLLCGHGCTPSTCKAYDGDMCERIGHLSDELGIEVDE